MVSHFLPILSLTHKFSSVVLFNYFNYYVYLSRFLSGFFLTPSFLCCINLFDFYLNCFLHFMGSKGPVPFQTIIPLKMNTHKVKGLLKGLRYISQVFEEEKKQEIQIGGPTDVKHVAHFGCDGQAQESPSWMRGFGTPAQSQSASSNLLEAPSHDGSDWVSEADTGQRMSRRERQEKLKSKHRRHRSVENAPDPDSQTKSRQPRRHHTRGPEGRRAQDESLPELPKRTRKKKPTDDVNPQASAVANAEK